MVNSLVARGGCGQTVLRLLPGLGSWPDTSKNPYPANLAGVPDALAILAKPGGLRQNTPTIGVKPGGLRQNAPAIGVKPGGLRQNTPTIGGKPGGLRQNTPAIGVKPGSLRQNTPTIGGKPGGLRQNTPAIGSNQVVWSKTHTHFASNSWFEGFRGC